MLYCSHEPCSKVLAYVHGSAMCVNSLCPMWGVKQVTCCEGETAE